MNDPMPDSGSPAEGQPLVSVVSAVYNVAAYLPRFLQAFEEQDIASDRFELIMVSDGSTDESVELIESYARRVPFSVRLLHKENGGQASARNLGLQQAVGQWVTFTDPDDWVDPNYISNFAAALGSDSLAGADLYAAKLVRYLEDQDKFDDAHPLAYRFSKNDQLVQLDRSPKFFHMHAASGFFRRDRLRTTGLRFDEDLPVFEDAAFTAEYLLPNREPRIGYLPNARYNYRIRASNDSSVQQFRTKREKYTSVLEHGHVRLAQKALGLYGFVPSWLQFMLLYDLAWYFRAENSANKPSSTLTADDCEIFHAHVHTVMSSMDVESVVQSTIPYLPAHLRWAIMASYKGPQHLPMTLKLRKVDTVRKLVKLSSVTTTADPNIIINRNGAPYSPQAVSVTPIKAYKRTIAYEINLWVPLMASASVTINGTQCALEATPSRMPTDISDPALKAIEAVRTSGTRGRERRRPPWIKAPEANRGHEVRQRRRIPRVRKRDLDKLAQETMSKSLTRAFDNCWLFMDRLGMANDNAEHLYRYVLNNHPEINAFFVLERSSGDWDRLKEEGFRLLEHGSSAHTFALCNALILASSHMDNFITNPLPKKLREYQNWRFVFLQHGITKHDLSEWFNSKDIDLIVTATKDEYNYFTQKHSPFTATGVDVSLTGFPRHDALHWATDSPVGRRIVVAPTWRKGLVVQQQNHSGGWAPHPDLMSSVHAQNLSRLLGSLAQELTGRGERVSFLPHPSMTGLGELLQREHPEIELLGWGEQSFSELLQTARIWITDYSSTAFEAALAGIPVVYLHAADEDVFDSSTHFYEKGYFDYDRDGFGPIARSAEEASSFTRTILLNGIAPQYRDRAERTFMPNDGLNSRRVFEAMTRLLRPAPLARTLSFLGADTPPGVM